MFQNYPNPFNPSTLIKFKLHTSDKVTLKIYNILGKELAVLIDGYRRTGEHRIKWMPENLQSGIYLCRLQAGKHTDTKKLIYQK